MVVGVGAIVFGLALIVVAVAIAIFAVDWQAIGRAGQGQKQRDDMITVYFIPTGTSVDVSENGAEYKAARLDSPLQSEGPAELTATHAVFVAGQLRIRVPRESVLVARYDGLGGVNQFGI